MSISSYGQDYFDRARLLAVAALLVTGILAIIGCFLTWVTFSLDEPGSIRNDHGPSAPVAGIKVSDSKVVLVAALVVVVCAILLALQRRSLFAWVCFIATMVIGAISVAEYRGLGDTTSGFIRGLEGALHTNIRGRAEPGLGLILVAISGIVGLIASVVAIAATPRHLRDQSNGL